MCIETSMIQIPMNEYTRLMEEHSFLACLMAAGVDSWEGYEYAQQLMDNEVAK